MLPVSIDYKVVTKVIVVRKNGSGIVVFCFEGAREGGRGGATTSFCASLCSCCSLVCSLALVVCSCHFL